MPLILMMLSSALLCLSLSVAYADDYSFGADDVEEDTFNDSGDASDEGGEDSDFVFKEDEVQNTPTQGDSTSGLNALGGFGGSDEMPKKKPLTPEELERIRKDENERIWVLQRRPFLKSDRFELDSMISMNINDPLVDFYTVGAQANYYLNEQMAIGLRGSYTLNVETSSFNEVIEDYQVFPQISRPIWSASLNFLYMPLYGKLSMFDTWIFPWEVSVRGGAGWIQTFIDGHVLLTLGAKQQFFLSRWFAFNIDLDYQVFQEIAAPGSSEDILINNLTFGAGFSIYFPLDFEYKELR